MFHLWVGMMTGALLAYLWTRRPDSLTSLYRRLRWWLAGSALVVLLTPVVADLWRFGSGSFGPIEGLRGVLLPWAAGVGFGIWMFQIIRLAAAGAGGAQEKAGAATQEEKDAEKEKEKDKGAGDEAKRQSLTFLPLVLALGFVTLILTEDRYGWLSRLQKVSFGGGGVEFAPAPSGVRDRGTQGDPNIPSASGDDRIAILISFMQNLAQLIERDRKYAEEVGFDVADASSKDDEAFAKDVIGPLGAHLKVVHEVRR